MVPDFTTEVPVVLTSRKTQRRHGRNRVSKIGLLVENESSTSDVEVSSSGTRSIVLLLSPFLVQYVRSTKYEEISRKDLKSVLWTNGEYLVL